MDKISGLVGRKGLDAVEDLYTAAGERVGDTLAHASSHHNPHDLPDVRGQARQIVRAPGWTPSDAV